MAPDQDYDDFGVFSGSAIVKDGKQYLLYTGVKIIGGERPSVSGCGRRPELRESSGKSGDSGSLCRRLRSEKFQGSQGLEGRKSLLCDCWLLLKTAERQLFSAPVDLRNWKFETILDKSYGKLGIMWAGFLPAGRYELTVSPIGMEAEGLEFHPGNNCIVLTGTYDPSLNGDSQKPLLRLGFCTKGRIIGWMQSCEKAFLPGELPWCGILSIPRELFLENGRLCQRPVRELENYLKEKAVYTDVSIGKKAGAACIQGKRMIDLSVTVKGKAYDKWTLYLAAGENHYSTITTGKRRFLLLTGLTPAFTGISFTTARWR